MMMVIDFLETSDPQRAKDTWWAVSGYLSQRAGFQEGQLVETFETVMPRIAYPFASITRWESGEQWDAARAAAKNDPEVLDTLANAGIRFTSMKMDLVDGREYVFGGASPRMVLVDIIYLEPEQIPGYAVMWSEANDFMGGQPGCVNASLFRNRDPDDPIKFVNLAEWETREQFFDVVHTERFGEIVEPYKTNFALLLTMRVLHRGENATSLLTGDAA